MKEARGSCPGSTAAPASRRGTSVLPRAEELAELRDRAPPRREEARVSWPGSTAASASRRGTSVLPRAEELAGPRDRALPRRGRGPKILARQHRKCPLGARNLNSATRGAVRPRARNLQLHRGVEEVRRSSPGSSRGGGVKTGTERGRRFAPERSTPAGVRSEWSPGLAPGRQSPTTVEPQSSRAQWVGARRSPAWV